MTRRSDMPSGGKSQAKPVAAPKEEKISTREKVYERIDRAAKTVKGALSTEKKPKSSK